MEREDLIVLISKSLNKEYNILLFIPMVLAFIVSLRFTALEIIRMGATESSYLLYAFIFQVLICIIEYLYFSRIKKNILKQILAQ